jgi:hypothetical protein
MLKTIASEKKEESVVLRATDLMDDGTTIALAISIDAATGSAVFDFEGGCFFSCVFTRLQLV